MDLKFASSSMFGGRLVLVYGGRLPNTILSTSAGAETVRQLSASNAEQPEISDSLALLDLQTTVTVYVFFLAMAMFPEVQQRAQTELDSVIGRDRLPSFEDRDKLPYVESVCKEVMRYHSAVPNGDRNH